MVGGLICVVGQVLIQTTKLTNARILVLFVTAGVFLTALGVYKPLVDFAGAGATVPLTGFGYSLAMGAIEAVNSYGILGALAGGVDARGGGHRRGDLLWTHQRPDLQAKGQAVKRSAPVPQEAEQGFFCANGKFQVSAPHFGAFPG